MSSIQSTWFIRSYFLCISGIQKDCSERGRRVEEEESCLKEDSCVLQDDWLSQCHLVNLVFNTACHRSHTQTQTQTQTQKDRQTPNRPDTDTDTDTGHRHRHRHDTHHTHTHTPTHTPDTDTHHTVLNVTLPAQWNCSGNPHHCERMPYSCNLLRLTTQSHSIIQLFSQELFKSLTCDDKVNGRDCILLFHSLLNGKH